MHEQRLICGCFCNDWGPFGGCPCDKSPAIWGSTSVTPCFRNSHVDAMMLHGTHTEPACSGLSSVGLVGVGGSCRFYMAVSKNQGGTPASRALETPNSRAMRLLYGQPQECPIYRNSNSYSSHDHINSKPALYQPKPLERNPKPFKRSPFIGNTRTP